MPITKLQREWRRKQSAHAQRIATEERSAQGGRKSDAQEPASQAAQGEGPGWTTEDWIASRHLHRILAPMLTSEASLDKEASSKSELTAMRALHDQLKSTPWKGKDRMLELLKEGNALERLAEDIWEGMEKLAGGGNDEPLTAQEMSDKFMVDGKAFTLQMSGLDSYWRGLEGLVGSPNVQVANPNPNPNPKLTRTIS